MFLEGKKAKYHRTFENSCYGVFESTFELILLTLIHQILSNLGFSSESLYWHYASNIIIFKSRASEEN